MNPNAVFCFSRVFLTLSLAGVLTGAVCWRGAGCCSGKQTKNKSITLFSSSTGGVEFRRKDFCSAPFPDSSNKFTLKSLSLCLSFPATSWWPSVLFKLLVKILLSLWLIKISKIKSDLHLALAHISNIYLLRTLPKQTKKVFRSFQRGKQSEEMKHEEKETNRRLCSQKIIKNGRFDTISNTDKQLV